MPLPLLRAYAAALPRLQAEESLLAMTRITLGSGTAEKNAARRIRAQWERQADAGQVGRDTTLDDRLGRAALAGIRVEKVRRAG